MKKNSGLILILIVVLLVGLFYSSDNTGSSGPSIGGGTTDVIVPPSGDDGSTDIIIPPSDEPTEEVETIKLTFDFDGDDVTIEYIDGMTWGEWYNSEFALKSIYYNEGDDYFSYKNEYTLVYDDSYGDFVGVTFDDLIDSSIIYYVVL